jgi:hypothetical protein
MTDLAAGFLGASWARHLADLIPHGGIPPLDRNLLRQGRQPSDVPPPLLQRRRAALTAYRTFLDDSVTHVVLADLLHLHHARMIGTDEESERTCLRLAKAISQAALRGRSDPSAPANEPCSAPAA